MRFHILWHSGNEIWKKELHVYCVPSFFFTEQNMQRKMNDKTHFH